MQENTQNGQKWFEVEETKGSGIGLKIMLVLLKCTPAIFMRILAFPVGFFYWLFSKKARNISKQFLIYEKTFSGRKNNFSSLRHIISFALNLVEDIQSWAGKFSFKNVNWQNDDVLDLVKNINSSKGTLIFINHVGNAQMLKGLASSNQAGVEKQMSITTIADIQINAGFQNLLKTVNSDVEFHIINSNTIAPDTIFLLQERLEKGEIVVIAGDRISANTERYIENDFLGKKAKFPYGVFLMAALLNVPTYHICGLRTKDLSIKSKYNMHVLKYNINFNCPRKEREQKIKELVALYANDLQKFAMINPCQWYNFYDFWA